MSLAPGTKLGPYEIASPLGAGGMGEVYRARDTRLDRCVAVKILPAHFSCSPELRSRFEREARTLSSVSHPHICHLYDVGSQCGTDFLVMELLEGETLAARIRKGTLTSTEVLKIGMEIADALASAHRLGLVHRDLKPSNIMLTKAGAKLMDFGLAKPAVNPVSNSGGSASAISGETLTTMHSPGSPITTAGAIVGTIQYMSPEQLEGREADARSDLFAFGAVLYEMATGQRAFEGKSYMSVASAILHKEPTPVNTLQPTSPPGLSYIISTCLAKDPDDRFQTAHDIKLQLGWLSQSSGSAAATAKEATQPRTWQLLVSAAVVAALLALGLGFWLGKANSKPIAGDSGLTRLTVSLPGKQELAVDTSQAMVLSPDGKRLAYVANESGVPHLYVRRLDRFDAVAISDSEGATFPFFSPGGDWVGYYSQQKLKKAPSDGGLPVVICDLPAFFGATWTPRDTIVAAVPTYGIATVPATGGAPQKLLLPNKESIYAQGLFWLGDGDWIGYTDYFEPRRTIKAINLSSGQIRPVLSNAQSAGYAAGHLVYYQGGAMWAVAFDERKLEVSGNPVELESGVNEENYVAQASVSRSGVLAYAPGPAGNFFRNLFLVNRKGDERKIGVPPQDYVDPAFSPDGKRIAVGIRSATVGQQIVVVDGERGTTINLLSNSYATAPVWSPDGHYLLFDSRQADQQKGIYRIAAKGGSAPQLLKTTPLTSHITSVEGDTAAVMVNDPVTNIDLWLLSLREPFEFKPFKVTAAAERQGALSPDGLWIAYASNDSGHSEIFVEPVPGPGGRQQISSDGGEQPRWVRNGKEIVYRNGTKIMSVPVQTQPVFKSGKALELFDRKFDRGGAVPGYDVSTDGQTFVMTRSERDSATQVRVVIGLPFGPRPF